MSLHSVWGRESPVRLSRGAAGRPLSLKPPASPTGAALQCYSCTAQVSNTDCLNVQNCSQSENSCWTSRVRESPLPNMVLTACHPAAQTFCLPAFSASFPSPAKQQRI